MRTVSNGTIIQEPIVDASAAETTIIGTSKFIALTLAKSVKNRRNTSVVEYEIDPQAKNPRKVGCHPVKKVDGPSDQTVLKAINVLGYFWGLV
jgi:hypothetical protein